jgi:hypothetical protein
VGSGVVRFLLAILASSAGISLMKSSRIPRIQCADEIICRVTAVFLLF